MHLLFIRPLVYTGDNTNNLTHKIIAVIIIRHDHHTTSADGITNRITGKTFIAAAVHKTK